MSGARPGSCRLRRRPLFAGGGWAGRPSSGSGLVGAARCASGVHASAGKGPGFPLEEPAAFIHRSYNMLFPAPRSFLLFPPLPLPLPPASVCSCLPPAAWGRRGSCLVSGPVWSTMHMLIIIAVRRASHTSLCLRLHYYCCCYKTHPLSPSILLFAPYHSRWIFIAPHSLYHIVRPAHSPHRAATAAAAHSLFSPYSPLRILYEPP